MTFWHAELVGWMVCWKEGVEKTMEIASAYETDIAYLNGPIRVPWTRPPQGMSIRRILDCKLFAKDVVVGHQDHNSQRRLSALVEVGWRSFRGCDRLIAYYSWETRNVPNTHRHAC
jgi:hypothetical protein